MAKPRGSRLVVSPIVPAAPPTAVNIMRPLQSSGSVTSKRMARLTTPRTRQWAGTASVAATEMPGSMACEMSVRRYSLWQRSSSPAAAMAAMSAISAVPVQCVYGVPMDPPSGSWRRAYTRCAVRVARGVAVRRSGSCSRRPCGDEMGNRDRRPFAASPCNDARTASGYRSPSEAAGFRRRGAVPQRHAPPPGCRRRGPGVRAAGRPADPGYPPRGRRRPRPRR